MKTRVVPVTLELAPAAARAIAAGFFDNEIWVWMVPSDRLRRRLLPRHYRAMIRSVFIPRAGAWTTENGSGAALWMPPGTHRMTKGERLVELRSLLPFGAFSLGRGARFDDMTSTHHPRERHWYLNTLAIEPPSQRQGHGSALIEPGLARADADHLPAYLETQRRSNIPFYRRFGFEVTDEISLEDSPPLWTMWREAR
jgi:ribosomal protein S18 acetylase RimI-like enzyme